MVSNAINAISDTIRSLCWVDKYCGLSRIARRKTESGKIESYPVSCGCDTDDCWNKGRYKDLVPDARKKSVIYWEQRSSVTTSQSVGGRRHQKDWVSLSTELDLLCWFNLKQLGKEQCSFCSEAFADLIRISGSINGIKVKVLEMNSPDYTARLFGKYSYADQYALFFFPYEICSFKIRLEWTIRRSCIEPVECNEPSKC